MAVKKNICLCGGEYVKVHQVCRMGLWYDVFQCATCNDEIMELAE
jgi:hypothetical protein